MTFVMMRLARFTFFRLGRIAFLDQQPDDRQAHEGKTKADQKNRIERTRHQLQNEESEQWPQHGSSRIETSMNAERSS